MDTRKVNIHLLVQRDRLLQDRNKLAEAAQRLCNTALRDPRANSIQVSTQAFYALRKVLKEVEAADDD